MRKLEERRWCSETKRNCATKRFTVPTPHTGGGHPRGVCRGGAVVLCVRGLGVCLAKAEGERVVAPFEFDASVAVLRPSPPQWTQQESRGVSVSQSHLPKQ